MTTTSQHETIKSLSRNFQAIRTSQNTPDSLGKAIIDSALRDAATSGKLASDGKTIELPVTMKLTPTGGDVARLQGCVTICAYGPGGLEIGCIQICVQ